MKLRLQTFIFYRTDISEIDSGKKSLKLVHVEDLSDLFIIRFLNTDEETKKCYTGRR
jgi:hypothetical protein